MLDLVKLAAQIRDVGRDDLLAGKSLQEKLINARQAFANAAIDPESYARRLLENAGEPWWPVAQPLFDEPIGTSYTIEPVGQQYTVVAADGSQILPSHHEPHHCYLLNIGTTTITYGVELPVVFESVPVLYHKGEDLYPLVDNRRLHVDDLFVSLERYLSEVDALQVAAEKALARALPVVALIDGPLFNFSAERMPQGYQAHYAERLNGYFDWFAANRVPVIGYVSNSRSTDVVNTLRVWMCPYSQSRCHEFCRGISEEDFPCSSVWPTVDRQLYADLLQRQDRSGIFRSGSRSSWSPALTHQLCFSYLNVGAEVARVEFPLWLATAKADLHFALAVLLAQVDKGLGYPVALAESHNLAVVRAADRSAFFQLLDQHLISLGPGAATASPKEIRKRRGVV